MDSIANINELSRPFRAAEPKRHPGRPHDPTDLTPVRDSLEISPRAEQLTNFDRARSQRAERVQLVRAKIQNHTFETEHRIDVTVQRIFAQLTALDLRA